MPAGTDLVKVNDSRITYTDMFGNPQSHTKTHDYDFDKRDVLEMYAVAFRYAVDKDDGGATREIFNENTNSYYQQSFDDYDALKKLGVAPDVMNKVADNMAKLIARQTQHSSEFGNHTADAILGDIADELKKPSPWNSELPPKVLQEIQIFFNHHDGPER